MKNLSVRNKIALALAASLFLVFGAVVLVNSYLQKRSLNAVYDGCDQALDWVVMSHVEGLLASGDEHKLEPIAAEFLARGVAREVTVVDATGRIAYSSESSASAGESDDPVWKRLFAERLDIGFDTTVNNEQVRVTYRLLRSDGAADNKADNQILGGLKTVRSRQAVVDASRNSVALNTIIGCASILVLIVGLVFILSLTIFQPLERVSKSLNEASRGDVDRDIEVRREDEIGALMASIRDLINYIRVFAWAAQRIADGDLTMEIEPKSEQDVLGHTFRKMIANLNGVTDRLASSAEQLVSAAGQISSTSEQMSHGARHQADQVSQISSAIEQMTATIVESSKNTTHISDVSRQTSQTAEAGGDVVGQTVHGMEQIAQIVTDSAASIAQLSQSAEKINAIVATISDIADQTNLLSLNAAIEAARAGDQGRGFAVVADEVRKLADKSSTAAREITDMTREIQDKTQAAVESMETGIAEVNRGREMADAAGTSLNEIVRMVRNVADLIQQIVTSASEQSVTAGEIAKSVDHVAGITRETATGAEQSSSAAEEMSRQAEGLRKVVAQFKRKEQKV